MNDYNYIKTYGWMFNTLKLDTTTALVYGLIYGFTKDDDAEPECSCSLSYFAESINRTKQTIINVLKKLIADGLVILTQTRASDGGLRNHYKANINKLKELGIESTTEHHRIKAEEPKNFTHAVKNFEWAKSKNQTEGGQKTLPHSNITDNDENYNDVRTHAQKEKIFEIGVQLTEQQIDELQKHYGDQFQETLRRFSDFIAANPKAYKKRKITHFEALSEWCEKDSRMKRKKHSWYSDDGFDISKYNCIVNNFDSTPSESTPKEQTRDFQTLLDEMNMNIKPKTENELYDIQVFERKGTIPYHFNKSEFEKAIRYLGAYDNNKNSDVISVLAEWAVNGKSGYSGKQIVDRLNSLDLFQFINRTSGKDFSEKLVFEWFTGFDKKFAEAKKKEEEFRKSWFARMRGTD